MTSIIIYGALAIGVLIALAGMFRSFNSAKVEASKTDQAKEDTAQKEIQKEEQKQKQDAANERRDDHLEARKSRWDWLLKRRDARGQRGR